MERPIKSKTMKMPYSVHIRYLCFGGKMKYLNSMWQMIIKSNEEEDTIRKESQEDHFNRTEKYMKEIEESISEYWKYFETIKDKMPPKMYKFFKNYSLHDGFVTSINMQDNNSFWQFSKINDIRKLNRPTIEIQVIQRWDKKRLFVLRYNDVIDVRIDFPHKNPYNFFSKYGFGDWVFDELTEIENGYFRHEIVLRSAYSISIDFKKFNSKIIEI